MDRPMRRLEKMIIFLPNERDTEDDLSGMRCYGFSEDGYKSQEENRGGSSSFSDKRHFFNHGCIDRSKRALM